LIIDWSKQRQAGADMRKITLAQIQAYQAITLQPKIESTANGKR
jgi:hypothetical protein